MTVWHDVHTVAQVRAAEEPALAVGVPLMRWAAAALAGVVADELVEPGSTARADGAVAAFPRDARVSVSGRLLVLAGKGNNGGDALYAAAELLTRAPGGVRVDVLCTAGEAHAEGFAAALAAGARTIELARLDPSAYDLVLDGILGIGTGAAAALRGGARRAVEALLPHVRAGAPRVIAVDIPSGLQPDEGVTADDVVLPAAVTVTFLAVKPGLDTRRGRELAGAVVCVDFADAPFHEPPMGRARVARIVDGTPGRAV